ncbi:MAG: hypothetical protein ACKVJU_11780 [Verrucomicrobiales bacterium]
MTREIDWDWKPGLLALGERATQDPRVTVLNPRSRVPVPLPLSACVPSSATLNDGTPATLLRKDGQLWALMPDKGIHTLTVNACLRGVTDWEWGFTLKPRRFTVEADGWSVSGIRPDGSAEDQVLFSRVRGERGSAATANYDRPDTMRFWWNGRSNLGSSGVSRRQCRPSLRVDGLLW